MGRRVVILGVGLLLATGVAVAATHSNGYPPKQLTTAGTGTALNKPGRGASTHACSA